MLELEIIGKTRLGRAAIRLGKVMLAAGASAAIVAGINAVSSLDVPSIVAVVLTATLVAADKYVRDSK